MKKIVSLLLVLVLALGMSTMAFAAKATDVKIYGGKDFDTGDWTVQNGAPATDGNKLGEDTVVQGGDEWKILIPFKFNGGSDVRVDDLALAKLTVATGTKSQASTAKVTFKTSLRSGSKVFDSISISDEGSGAAKAAYIKLVMQEYFVSTGDVDFEIRLIPYLDGSRQSNEEILVSGNYANREETIDADNDWVDMSDGTVVEAEEYNKLIEAELGEGVVVWTKMFKDKKYYGVAIRDDDEKDDTVYTKYPDIDSIITMRTVGLSSTAQYVTFQDYDDTFYVYGADFKYLGKSNEKVAFSSKYYLANKMLDVDEEGDEEPYDDEEYDDEIPEAGPITGGDGYPENVNDNPGTGK